MFCGYVRTETIIQGPWKNKRRAFFAKEETRENQPQLSTCLLRGLLREDAVYGENAREVDKNEILLIWFSLRRGNHEIDRIDATADTTAEYIGQKNWRYFDSWPRKRGPES